MSRPFHQKFDPRPVFSKNKAMNKILLVYDDYAELTTVEFSLKKVGFDVISISSEFSMQEKMLSFNPEIVIAYGRGPKVTTIGVGKRLKEMGRWAGKSLLIFPQGVKPNPQDLIRARMDLLLEAPVPTVRLIQILAKMTNQDDQVLVEKLIKAAATESTEAAAKTSAKKNKDDDTVFVGGQGSGSGAEEGQFVGSSSGKESEDKLAGSSFNMKPEIESFGSENENEKNKAIGLKSGSESTKKNQFVLNPESEALSDKSDFEADKLFVNHDESLEKSEALGKSGVFGQSERPQDPFKQMMNELKLDPIKSFEVEPLVPPQITDPHYQQEVDEARKNLSARTHKYTEFTKELSLNPESSLQRSKVRKEQKKLAQDWDTSENEELDKLRRKFANALFKK